MGTRENGSCASINKRERERKEGGRRSDSKEKKMAANHEDDDKEYKIVRLLDSSVNETIHKCGNVNKALNQGWKIEERLSVPEKIVVSTYGRGSSQEEDDESKKICDDLKETKEVVVQIPSVLMSRPRLRKKKRKVEPEM